MLVLKLMVTVGKGMTINKRNYNGFCKCAFVWFLWLKCGFWCAHRFSDVSVLKTKMEKNRQVLMGKKRKTKRESGFILMEPAVFCSFHSLFQSIRSYMILISVITSWISLCLQASSHYRPWMQLCCIHCISNLLRLRGCAIEHDHTFFVQELNVTSGWVTCKQKATSRFAGINSLR